MHISEPTQDIIDDPYFDESIPQSQGSSQMNLQRFVSAHDMEFEEESEGMHVVVSHTQGTRVVETEEIEEPEPEVVEALPEQHGEPEELEEPEPQLDPEPESSSERRVVLVATTDESDPLPRAATGARTQSSPAHPPSSGAAPPAQRRKRARDSVATNASADADVEDDAPPRAKRMRDQLVTQATPARYAYTPLMPSTPATPASGMVTARRFVPDTNRSEASMRSARSSPSPAQPRSAKQSLQPSPTGTLHWKPNLRVPGLKGAAVRRMAEQARRERARLEEIRRVKMERK
jgi:hypothetical protein